jgi:ParB/RepB/Spo0J family partition protein
MSRRVPLAEALDATGISNGDRSKTSGVVDLLTAPAVAIGDHTVVDIELKWIVPHPRNRKILDEDVADLVAEFKAGIPILNPLGVTAAADWNAGKPADLKEIGPLEFIITAGGHRRLRAAELAGLKTVPCIVRANFAGVDGRRAALLENLHRQDLDPFEEAAAFEELTGEPYKLSQRELASIVDVNQSHISKRLKLLKLPSTIREKVRLGKMTIADAMTLAGVVDNKAVFDVAMKQLDRGYYGSVENVVRTAQREHDQAAARGKAVQAVTVAGGRLIDRAPSYYAVSKNEPSLLEDLKLDVDKHSTEPCHAFYVRTTYDGKAQTETVCDKPGRHVKTGDSKLKVRKSIEEQLTSRTRGGDAEAKKRAERRELKKLYPARCAIAKQLVLGQTELSVDAERELVARGVIGSLFHSDGRKETWTAIVAVTGIEDLEKYPTEKATDELMRRLPMRAVQRAIAIGYFESRIRSSCLAWNTDSRYYLELLEQHGYTIDRLEKAKLRSIKAGSQPAQECRVCHSSQLPAGVTWVAEDLCSGCSDAAEAGWVEVPAPSDDAALTAVAEGRCAECEHAEPTTGCTCPTCFCNPANVDEPSEAVAS